MADTEWSGPNKPNFVKVLSYRENDPDPSLAKNPMALVFPPPLSVVELYAALEVLPQSRSADFRSKSLEERKEYLDRIDEFHYVFEIEIDLVNKVVYLVRKSFVSRDPRNPRVFNSILRIMQGEEVKTPRTSKAGAGGGLGLLIFGSSGAGKSSLIDRICDHLGDYGRFHQSLNGEPAQWPQLGVIRVAVKDTWKSTLSTILGEIDRQLGRDYYLKREKGATERRLSSAVHEALTAGFAPVLILDEMQRLVRLNEAVAQRILEGLIDIMGEWGVPVILVGTVRISRLLERFPAEMDKFSNSGDVEFHTLESDNPDTKNFISLLKEYAVSQTDVVYSPDFDLLLVHYSMGIRRIMREYMKSVLQRHANDERLVANEALLISISEREMKRFQKSLSVLRKAKLGIRLTYADLQAYEDYLPQDTEKKKQTAAQVRIDAAWRIQNRTSLHDDDSPDINVADYAKLAVRLAQENSRQPEEDEEEMQESPRTAGKDFGPPGAVGSGERAAIKRSKARKQRAAKKVKEASNVVSLGAVKTRKAEDQDAIDPSSLK